MVLKSRKGRMVQALTILTALQMFSEGGLPTTEAAGGPYGIDRGVVEGAALAGSSFNTPAPSGRDLGNRPVPAVALSQVTPTAAPSSDPFEGSGGGSPIGMADEDDILVPEKTMCNGGLGEVRYEKLSDVRLVSRNFDSDVIRKNAMPSAVLALCQDRCLKDRTGAQMLPKQCSSIDFVPGRRFSSYSDSIEFTETKCFLSQSEEEGVRTNSITQFERAPNYAHYKEVCFPAITTTSARESPLSADCPDRLYVVERTLGKRFLPKNADEVTASSIEECQNICINQQNEDPTNSTTICRAGTWDRGRSKCYLSSFTRRTHPFEFVDDPDMDYFENTCLSAERRCPKNQLFYLKEVNAELGGPYDSVTFVNVTLDQCKEKCIEGKTIFCRSMEYDVRTRVCVLSDQDSTSKRDELRSATSNDNIYFELQCFDGEAIKGEYMFQSDPPLTSPNTEPLNARSFRDVYTAFQLFRNRNLQLKAGFRSSPRERNRVTLAECLDECLEERTFACRSVSYSQRYQICRLSEYDQYNGDLQYDAEYDYFENLMGAGSAPTSDRRAPVPSDDTRTGSKTGFGGNSGSFDSFNRNSIDDRRTGDRFNTRLNGNDRNTNVRATRPGPFVDRPGLFRPISTDFTSRNQDRDNFRDRGTANTFSNTFGVSTAVGAGGSNGVQGGRGQVDRGQGGGGGLGLFDLFGGGERDFQRDRNNDRFNNGLNDRRNQGNTGRFSSTAIGTVADNERFGGAADPFRRPVGAAGNTGGSLGSSGLFSGAAGSIGSSIPATSNLGKIPGEADPRKTFGSFKPPPYRPWGFGGTNDIFPPTSTKRPRDNVIFNSRETFNPFRTETSVKKCYTSSSFRLREQGHKIRYPYVKKYVDASSKEDCSRECLNEKNFVCRSFNFRSPVYRSDDNCQLSETDAATLNMRNPLHFDSDVTFGYYELDRNKVRDNCPHVAQNCYDDGSMEFTLRTDDSFRGRIYVYGYYDRCFTVGRGNTENTLRISSPTGFPDCGTIRYGDTITNIVVVQFSENVQTMMDKRYNLTCTTVGPTDSVVTSSYIGAGYGVAGVSSSAGGGPTQIEYLELENRLDQRVALRVLYDGRPTTTIAVGDPLTFKLEPQAGYNLVSDIFATNVVARDPYSGRTVQLIDSRGCPVDNYIFPSLGRARSGEGLETRFSAFKIPESNFLVFEANVRPCKGQCSPAFCRDSLGREESESFGRRRRDVSNFTSGDMNETLYQDMTEEEWNKLEEEKRASEEEPVEHVHGIYEVYLSREEIPPSPVSARLLNEVCLSPASYNGLLVGLILSILLLIGLLLVTVFIYRNYMRGLLSKNSHADSINPSNQFSHQPLHDSTRTTSFPGSHPRTVPQPNRYFPEPKPDELTLPNSESKAPFRDPSEPMYTDHSLFEKSKGKNQKSTIAV